MFVGDRVVKGNDRVIEWRIDMDIWIYMDIYI